MVGSPAFSLSVLQDEMMEINPDDIETVFKVEPPLSEIDGGHGYLGVVLRDKASDKLQCHICGEWFTSLSQHVNISHQISSREYKIRYGLPLGFPLVARKLSKSMSDRMQERKRNPKFKGGWPKGKSRKNTFGNLYRVRNSSFLNKHGICEEQMERRFLIVADTIGKEPSGVDLRKYDNSLRSAIERRYGTINRFKKHLGIPVTIWRSKVWSEVSLLAAIIKKFHKLGRIPRWKDFVKGRPNYSVIKSHFGSWNRALKLAGF